MGQRLFLLRMSTSKYIIDVLWGAGVTELKLYFFCLLLYNTKYRQQGGRNMRLNQATDYAFRMVLYLASLPEGTKITGAALAEKQNIPERFLLKIMRSLTKAGIMKSYRGVEGGFALQRAPKDITLFDIIDAVEGQTELQRCLHDIGSCSRGCSGMCSIYAAFADIQRDLAARLKSINFETLAKQEANLRMVHEAEAQLTAKKEAAEK